MSEENIASFASIQKKKVSTANAKLAIFAADMLWESCFNLNLIQDSHSMSVENNGWSKKS